ncbi:GPP34 family phosphoprotein [Mycobacterium sp. NPDC051804]|uniref:GOLPH3/VPS74 family protein n=1 Tax=Mycobacterium sp. NPDC051804 TaxID=3364295 RepID=UPI00379EBF79
MAQIAEDLLLLLLDNASAQPGLEQHRRERVLAAAVLLDLAYACRVRPSMAADEVEPGRLVALSAPGMMDPISESAFQMLQRRPMRSVTAVKKLSKRTENDLTHQLEQSGEIRRIRLQSNRFTHPYAWPLTNRGRVGQARSALLAALFDRRPPTPATAAITTLLHAVDGLGALLSLNDRGWRWVHARAGEIASGSWVDEYPTSMREVNLAVTASALRPALG